MIYSIFIYLGSHYIIALLIDYVVGIFLGLMLNKRYTFNVNGRIGHKIIIKAIISNVFIFLINVAILYLLIDVFENNAYLSQLFTLIVIAISSFLFYKYYIFKVCENGK